MKENDIAKAKRYKELALKEADKYGGKMPPCIKLSEAQARVAFPWLELNEQYCFPGHIRTLAGLYMDKHKYADAEQLYRKALSIDEATYGFTTNTADFGVQSLVRCLTKENKLKEADSLLTRTEESLKKRSTDYLGYRNILKQHAEILVQLKDYKQAEAKLKLMTDLCQKNDKLDEKSLAQLRKQNDEAHRAGWGGYSLNSIGALQDLAQSYHQIGEFAKEEAVLARVISLSEKINFQYPVLQSWTRLAECQEKQGNYKQAAFAISQAIDFLNSKRGADLVRSSVYTQGVVNHDLACNYHKYAMYLTRLGRNEEAKQMAAQAHKFEPAFF